MSGIIWRIATISLALSLLVGLLQTTRTATTTLPNGDASTAGLSPLPIGAQPDLRLRLDTQPAYQGDNLYSPDGSDQGLSATTDGTRVTFLLHVQNDGSLTEPLTVRGGTGRDGWTVTYLTMGATPVDLTAQITGEGWTTKTLQPGQYDLLQVRVTPSATVWAGVPLVLLLTASSPSDPSAVDVARLEATLRILRRPDLALRLNSEAAYAGNNVYNVTGEGQTRAQSVPPGTPATYVFRAQNDGNTTDTFTLCGPAGAAGWRVRYYTGSGEITAQVTGGGWSTGPLAPAAVKTLWATVAADAAVPGGSEHTLALTQACAAQPDLLDTVQCLTRVEAAYQPDVQLRLPSELTYSGMGLYNTTGIGQTKAQSVKANQWGVYLLLLRNDGSAPDRFRLTGPANQKGWRFRYFTTDEGNISDPVTQDGWVSPELVPGASYPLWVSVSPNSSITPGASRGALITVASEQAPTAVDAVLLLTTRQ